MKTFKLLSCLCVAAVCISCVKGGKNTIRDTYHLYLSFQDTDGNDLVGGIEGTLSDVIAYGGRVDPGQYELTSSYSPNHSPELWLFAPSAVLQDPGPDRWLFSIYTREFRKDRDVLVTIIHTLTCPYVFGDDKPHEIVTVWSTFPDNRAVRSRTCIGMAIDGKEVPDLSYSDGRRASFATIVLDRE